MIASTCTEVSEWTIQAARLAGVNECTLFRKFQNKKDVERMMG